MVLGTAIKSLGTKVLILSSLNKVDFVLWLFIFSYYIVLRFTDFRLQL